MANSAEEIQKSKRTYLIVFGALMFFTCLTVAVAQLEVLDFGRRGFDMADCIIGLTIASVKAMLVALIFMHLNHEKKAVYWLFGAGIVCVICLAGLTALAESDPIWDPLFFKK